MTTELSSVSATQMRLTAEAIYPQGRGLTTQQSQIPATKRGLSAIMYILIVLSRFSVFDLQHTSMSLAATVIKRLSNFISDQDHRGTTRVVESEGYDFGHAVLYPVSAVCAYTSIGRYLDSHIKRQLQ